MKRIALSLALLGFLVLAGPAHADPVVLQDREGRAIHFDVQADGVDVEWYAELLRNAAHGDEIAAVTIRIVPGEELASYCGAGAGGCYGGRAGQGLITVPAGQSASVAHTVVHEYGHHLDAAYPVPGVPEPNGTPSWWGVRDLARLVEAGEVSRTYSLGWDRSIGEIFAEDYAQLHLQTVYKISWLAPPDESVRAALQQDLSGVPASPAPASLDPVVLVRRGTLGPGAMRTLPFGLLGPGRRVTFTATVTGAAQKGVRTRLELRCGDGTRISKTLVKGQQTATIDRRRLGPTDCEVALRSTARAAVRYTVRLRLAIEQLSRR